MKLQHRMEYVKLFWKHDYPDDPVVIIYDKVKLGKTLDEFIVNLHNYFA